MCTALHIYMKHTNLPQGRFGDWWNTLSDENMRISKRMWDMLLDEVNVKLDAEMIRHIARLRSWRSSLCLVQSFEDWEALC